MKIYRFHPALDVLGSALRAWTNSDEQAAAAAMLVMNRLSELGYVTPPVEWHGDACCIRDDAEPAR
jgi:hypothetical protein